jgi:eukaryotic-like serine/threonine-protein kinase
MSKDYSQLIQQLHILTSLTTKQIQRVRQRVQEQGEDLLIVLRSLGVSETQLQKLGLIRTTSSSGFPVGKAKQHALSRGMMPAKRSLPNLHKDSNTEARPIHNPNSPVLEFTKVLLDITDRFEVFEEIAHGAMGRIDAGWDRHLGRPVAIKTLRSDRAKDVVRMRFLEEAQVTGQLQHPNIITIYELGKINGNVSFVMRKVDGQSLKQLIQKLRKNDPKSIEEHTLTQKVQIFAKLCQAVAFAHSRGVIHRDIKPSNVMLGDFGDVVLLDWGLCKIIGQEVRSSRSSTEKWQTVHGQIIGTPSYMSPEQALGMIDQICPATDVYGLGALLYHFLTLYPPFMGKSNREVVRRVLQAQLIPPRERKPEAEIPAELERICLKCLNRDAEQRYVDANELNKDIQAFLEGKHVNYETSHSAIAVSKSDLFPTPKEQRSEIEENLFHYQAIQEDLASAQDIWHTTQLQTWFNSHPQLLADRWNAQVQISQYRNESESLLARLCEQLIHYQMSIQLHETVSPKSDNSDSYASHDSIEMLCTLLASRYENAVIEGDEITQAQMAHWLQAFDPLQGEMISQNVGALYIHVRPMNAHIQLWQCRDENGILKKSKPKTLKSSPLLLERVPAGQYILSTGLSYNKPKVETSLKIYPGVTTRFSVTLYHEEAAPAEFKHIPAGTFRSGAPQDLFSPASEIALPDIFIAEHPVSAQDYLLYLQDLNRVDPREAKTRQPRRSGDHVALWAWDHDGIPYLPLEQGWLEDMPVIGISLDDALHYCEWFSKKKGGQYRLPTDHEWEKAARGMDGRTYPWGEVWDARYVAGPEVWEHYLPPPIGFMSTDASTYGVKDLVGGVREWTLHNEFLHQDYTEGTLYGVVKGGSFLTDNLSGRPLWRKAFLPVHRVALDLGFRVAYVADPAFRILENI